MAAEHDIFSTVYYNFFEEVPQPIFTIESVMKYGMRTPSSHIYSSKLFPENIYDLRKMRKKRKKKSQFRSLFVGDGNAARGISQCSFCHGNHPSYANRNWKDLRWDLAKYFGPSYFFFLAVHPSPCKRFWCVLMP
ncbi:hypothetical protein CEXT_421141 [Caerostris extrusa]|uniref:Uncharacterized protein n=1 Tax=Caerostris extrusa TaxID=172846 RepID=A0AAV4VJ82_CAEEX|nr:hypothetical protein CEXT_421141 [Caerostris extrusa]